MSAPDVPELTQQQAVDVIVAGVVTVVDTVSREVKRGRAAASLLERFVVDLATALGMVDEGAEVAEVDPLAVLAAAVERIKASG